MTWLKIVGNPNPPKCECRVPNMDAIREHDAWPGSRWECVHCGKVWELIDGPAWQPLTKYGPKPWNR